MVLMPRRPLSDASSLLFTRRGLRLRDTQNTHHWSPRVNNGQRGWALTRLVLCLLRAQSRAYDRYPNTQFVLAAVYTEDNVGRLRDTVIGSAIVFVSWIRSLRAHGRPVRGPCTPFFHPLPPRAPSLYQLQKLLQLCTALYSLHYIHFTVCTHISLEKPVVQERQYPVILLQRTKKTVTSYYIMLPSMKQY